MTAKRARFVRQRKAQIRHILLEMSREKVQAASHVLGDYFSPYFRVGEWTVFPVGSHEGSVSRVTSITKTTFSTSSLAPYEI